MEVPAGHGLQIDELKDEYSPAGHRTQASEVLEPTSVKNEPAGHGVHETDALVSEYDPGGHGIQSRFVGGRNVPTGHGTQEPFWNE